MGVTVGMTHDYEPTIVKAEQIDNGVFVRFAGGESAIYPAVLLHSAIQLAGGNERSEN